MSRIIRLCSTLRVDSFGCQTTRWLYFQFTAKCQGPDSRESTLNDVSWITGAVKRWEFTLLLVSRIIWLSASLRVDSFDSHWLYFQIWAEWEGVTEGQQITFTVQTGKAKQIHLVTITYWNSEQSFLNIFNQLYHWSISVPNIYKNKENKSIS